MLFTGSYAWVPLSDCPGFLEVGRVVSWAGWCGYIRFFRNAGSHEQWLHSLSRLAIIVSLGLVLSQNWAKGLGVVEQSQFENQESRILAIRYLFQLDLISGLFIRTRTISKTRNPGFGQFGICSNRL